MNAVTEQVTKENPAQPAESARGYVTPGVNILETPDAFLLEAELPGVDKNGLEISVEDNVLTLVGRRSPAPEATPLYRESVDADYRRVFKLDPTIESGRITARLEQGVASITLPKAERAKPQKIVVE